MTITYHSGKRLQGIESDRAITTNFDGAGGTESTNGAKSVFTFTSVGSTNFVLTGSGDVEYLIVAGGAGGGKTSAGGGGAGGMKTGTFTNLAAGTYSVVVGAAGTGSTQNSVNGTNGGDSSVNSITSTGGGGGSGYPNAGGNGGSGGGCSEGQTNNGTGISGQGYDGGDSSHENSGAGGGGAGAVGNGTTTTGSGGGGLGGVGVSSSISGSAYFYSAGGSGCNNTSTGASGKGGVGSGNDNSNAGNATGYGSGGGGARNSGNGGGNGGDGYQGIVILSLTPINTTTYPLNSNTSPAGSRFEETDTRKFYTKDLNGWQEKGTALGYRHDSTYAQNQPAEANPFTTINKQHFVEWFSGKQLPSYWSQENTAGTGTFAMVDAVDEGFSITTTSGTSNRNTITFNQIDPFAYDGSVFIAVARRVTSANAGLNLGFSQDDDFTIATGQSWAVINEDTATGTHKALQTRDGSNHSQILSSVPINTSWTNYKLVLSSDAKLYINGNLEITKTLNLPIVKLQPAVRSISRASNTSEIRVRYLEAYNT